MTITKDDIRAAIGAGKISEAQAAAILALSDARRGARENLDGLDEPFELFRGFNEVFIVIGLVILYAGYTGITGAINAFDVIAAERISTSGTIFALIGMAGIAAAARYFTLRRRMIAPSIALSIMFSFSATLFAANVVNGIGLGSDGGKIALLAAIVTGLMFLFWLFFRIPFAMLIIAIGVYATAFAVTALIGHDQFGFDEIFFLSSQSAFPWVTLGLGLVALVVALRFDMSDPHRVTRRSAQGFWLHVIAAPAIVNTVALTLFDADNTASLLILAGFLIIMALFAITIDRRSFLIAGIGYMVALLSIVADDQTWLLIFILGLFLVLLGSFWTNIRGRIMASLPAFPGKDRLPPWTTADEMNT